MSLYLYGQSSLDVLRYLRATEDGQVTGHRSRPRTLDGAIHTNRQLKELDETATRWLSHIGGQVHVLVPTNLLGESTKRIRTHVWSRDIPNGAFMYLDHDVYLCTPGFLFLQMAHELSEIELIKLGLELCGSYTRWKLPAVVWQVDEDAGNPRGCTFELLPVTEARLLKAFIKRMAGQRGSVDARHALRFVIDDSASPMESAVYLLLCLPRHMGGLGLPAPVFNPTVYVDGPNGRKARYPDLYWKGRSIDVEYNSDAAHSGEWCRYRDAKREVELEAQHVTVLPLTRAQIMDEDDFLLFADSLRRLLGIRRRPLADDWIDKHRALREATLNEYLE